jgi:hypothetical protein
MPVRARVTQSGALLSLKVNRCSAVSRSANIWPSEILRATTTAVDVHAHKCDGPAAAENGSCRPYVDNTCVGLRRAVLTHRRIREMDGRFSRQ